MGRMLSITFEYECVQNLGGHIFILFHSKWILLGVHKNTGQVNVKSVNFFKKYICNVVVMCAFRTVQVRSLILQTILLPWICFIPAFSYVPMSGKLFFQFVASTVLKITPEVPCS